MSWSWKWHHQVGNFLTYLIQIYQINNSILSCVGTSQKLINRTAGVWNKICLRRLQATAGTGSRMLSSTAGLYALSWCAWLKCNWLDRDIKRTQGELWHLQIGSRLAAAGHQLAQAGRKTFEVMRPVPDTGWLSSLDPTFSFTRLTTNRGRRG